MKLFDLKFLIKRTQGWEAMLSADECNRLHDIFVFRHGLCGIHRVINSCSDLAERHNRLHIHVPDHTYLHSLPQPA